MKSSLFYIYIERERERERERGITLLPTVYKLFANVIKNRLNEHLEEEMLEEQCGFRKGRSCNHAIFTMQQVMEKRI